MKINVILLITLLTFISCVSKKKPRFLEGPKPGRAFINKGSYRYIDFPYEDTLSSYLMYEENFEEGGLRYGNIIKGYKEGKWLSGDAGFDSLGNVYIKSGIWKEEYFKKGLRDSVFRQFDDSSNVVYETQFKMGTGLWKEIYGNGKVYFEIETKDGYFTDTLKLYNREGINFQKRLYQKDTLIYYIGNDDWCLKYRYKPDNDTYLEVDSYTQKNLKQGTFRNTFKYKTKEEFENDYFAKSTLKR